MNASLLMTLTLAVLLLANLGTKLWLATRQARHVARHRDAVPSAFATAITLEAHRKAADYTLAKSRLAVWDIALEALLLLGWTLLGGLDWLNRTLLDLMGPWPVYLFSGMTIVFVIWALMTWPWERDGSLDKDAADQPMG